MAQRISRAKARLREVGAALQRTRRRRRCPAGWPRSPRCCTSSSPRGTPRTTGGDLNDPSLSAEAIRLTRLLHGYLPSAGEVTGLLALMLLTDARRAARTRADGSLVLLAEQDRHALGPRPHREGVRLVEQTLPAGPVGPYQLQAAIAAVHAEAPDAADDATGRRSSCSTGCCTSRRPVPW